MNVVLFLVKDRSKIKKDKVTKMSLCPFFTHCSIRSTCSVTLVERNTNKMALLSIFPVECVGDSLFLQLHHVPSMHNLIIVCAIYGDMTIPMPIRDGSLPIHDDISSFQELPCLESR